MPSRRAPSIGGRRAPSAPPPHASAPQRNRGGGGSTPASLAVGRMFFFVIQTNCKHFYSFLGPYINSCCGLPDPPPSHRRRRTRPVPCSTRPMPRRLGAAPQCRLGRAARLVDAPHAPASSEPFGGSWPVGGTRPPVSPTRWGGGLAPLGASRRRAPSRRRCSSDQRPARSERLGCLTDPARPLGDWDEDRTRTRRAPKLPLRGMLTAPELLRTLPLRFCAPPPGA